MSRARFARQVARVALAVADIITDEHLSNDTSASEELDLLTLRALLVEVARVAERIAGPPLARAVVFCRCGHSTPMHYQTSPHACAECPCASLTPREPLYQPKEHKPS